MDIELELRAMDQARLTTDGIHLDSIEGQAWLNRFFQERLDELEVELFDTGLLKEEGASNEPTITTFVPPNLETRLEAGTSLRKKRCCAFRARIRQTSGVWIGILR